MYMINNNTKYYIVRRDDTKEFWEYNPYYAWNKVTHSILIHIPRNRVTEASKHENKEVIFNDTGSRKTTSDNESDEGPYKYFPTDYQQSSYHELNGYVWIIVYLIIGSQDSQSTEYLLRRYKMNCKA